MIVTIEMTKAVYTAADVYDGKISKEQAIDYLETKFNWNRSSASDSIVFFKKMMDGKRYTFTNNIEQTDYFLTHILNDYGAVKLGNAIKTANEHLRYQEGLGKRLWV